MVVLWWMSAGRVANDTRACVIFHWGAAAPPPVHGLGVGPPFECSGLFVGLLQGGLLDMAGYLALVALPGL